MGGWSSGRHDGGPTVEEGCKLDLSHCIRKRMILPGQHVSGTMKWTITRTGEVIATIGYEAKMTNPESAWLRLHYTITPPGGAKKEHDYRVQLETTRPHYGGVRWWMRCPLSGRRARVLYLPGNGGHIFASRQAWGLTYQSQRMSEEDRSIERSLKARKKLNVKDQNMLDMPYCPKPKWMRQRTHRRLVGVIFECHDVQMRYMIRKWGHPF
jgi:hypothetical protein